MPDINLFYRPGRIRGAVSWLMRRWGLTNFDLGAYTAAWIAEREADRYRAEKIITDANSRTWGSICEIDDTHKWLGPWAQRMEKRLMMLLTDPSLRRANKQAKQEIANLVKEVAKLARAWDTFETNWPWDANKLKHGTTGPTSAYGRSPLQSAADMIGPTRVPQPIGGKK